MKKQNNSCNALVSLEIETANGSINLLTTPFPKLVGCSIM